VLSGERFRGSDKVREVVLICGHLDICMCLIVMHLCCLNYVQYLVLLMNYENNLCFELCMLSFIYLLVRNIMCMADRGVLNV
jgi:hypothetical protein